MSERRTVIAIGQFPPPINGFSYITSKCLEAFRQHHRVFSQDIAPSPNKTGMYRHLSRVCRTLAACAALAQGPRTPGRICYIACEGGLGLIYTVLVVATARMFGYAIYLHHHSFQYVDRARPLMRVVLAIGGAVTHVFLCGNMWRRFQETYNCRVRGAVLSNAAFVPPLSSSPRPSSGELVLGHLSNLTREKGLYLFIDLLRSALAAGFEVRGVLAGPAAEADLAAIRDAEEELHPQLAYLGPVYGVKKDDFYRAIDVFVFPTQYINEAQPMVLFEAAAAGCFVVSYDRGCIASQVDGLGISLARDEDFIIKTLDWLHSNPAFENRTDRQAVFQQRHMDAISTLGGLFQPGAITKLGGNRA